MAQFGSGRSIIAQNQSAVADSNGNLIVSPDDSWNASPLGIAARNQVSIGVPNGTFNILPADPVGDINAANPLPYWDWAPDNGFVAAMGYDTTTQTNSVEIDPTGVGTALGTAVLRTRIPITNDEGLDIRQYVSSSLVQFVKSAGTDKWVATLTSQYYDTAGLAIGTPYIIGTIGERGSATNLASYTNASGFIDTTAAELELAYKVVVGTANPDLALKIKSVMVATEYGVIGGGGGGTGFIPLSVITAAGDLIRGAAAGSATRIAQGTKDQVLTVTGTALGSVGWSNLPTTKLRWIGQVFTSSGDFIVPTNVTHVTVVAMGGGQGGSAGAGTVTSSSSLSLATSSGGATGAFVVLPDFYVADVGTVSVGIGAGGTGGSATTLTKATGGTAVSGAAAVAGASGAATTFGSYLSVGGGGGTTVTSLVYGALITPGTSGLATGVGATHAVSAFTLGFPSYPDLTFVSPGNAGTGGATTGATTSATGAGGTATAGAGFGGAGGQSGTIGVSGSTLTASNGIRGGSGGSGSGGAGAVARMATNNLVVTVTGGAGANAVANSGSGGGGGGPAATTASGTAAYNSADITLTTGKGGNGGAGFLAVTWLEAYEGF